MRAALVDSGRAVPQRRRHVALVSAPFLDLDYPSVALATLAARLRRDGHDVEVLHLQLDAARALGVGRYRLIDRAVRALVGEWLFAHPSITPGAADEAAYRSFLAKSSDRFAALLVDADLMWIRARLDVLLDRWEHDVDWGKYDVVGFSILFQQLNAALRLGLRLKTRWPSLRVVFGGGLLEAPMGRALRMRYRWIDAVFSGYSERTLAEYVRRLPGFVDEPVRDEAPPQPLDELPVPEYEDYFDALGRTGMYRMVDVRIPLETSRGCWWGEKHRCTFCGLNALGVAFRQKSPDRILREVQQLRRYGRRFHTVDKILPVGFFEEVLPRFAQAGVRYDTHYDIRANVTRGQLEEFVRLGIRSLTPGIESLSTSVLRTMKKGVTACQNLWLLRAQEELGITPYWNFLYGFPDEDVREYERLAELIPTVQHLPQPHGAIRVRLDRFAPLYDEATSFGLTDIRPSVPFGLAYGAHAWLADQAYYFDFAFADGRDPGVYARAFIRAVAEWVRLRRQPGAPRCEVIRIGRKHLVFDTRRLDRVGRALPRVRELSKLEWEVLQAVDRPVARSTAIALGGFPAAELEGCVARLEKERLVASLDDRLVRVAVVRADPSVSREIARVVVAKTADAVSFANGRASDVWATISGVPPSYLVR